MTAMGRLAAITVIIIVGCSIGFIYSESVTAMVDFVLFDSPEQVAEYKRLCK